MNFLYTVPVYRIGDTKEYPLEGITLYFYFNLWYNYYSK